MNKRIKNISYFFTDTHGSVNTGQCSFIEIKYELIKESARSAQLGWYWGKSWKRAANAARFNQSQLIYTSINENS